MKTSETSSGLYLVEISPDIWYIPKYHLIIEANRPSVSKIEKHIRKLGLMPVNERDGVISPDDLVAPNDLKLHEQLQTVTIEMTDACMLKCPHCYLTGSGQLNVERNEGKRNINPTVILDRLTLIISQCKEKQLTVQFIGGEPLVKVRVIRELIPKIRDIAKRYDIEIIFQIITNGVLLGPAILDFFRKNKVEIILSLEGQPDIQDTLRPFKNGSGSSEIILRNVSGYESDISVLLLLCRQTRNLTSVLKYLFEKGFARVSFNFVYTNDPSIALTSEDCNYILDDIDRNWDFYYRNRGRIRNFERISSCLDNSEIQIASCTAGRSYIAVGADDKYYICQRAFGMPEMTLDRLRMPDSTYKIHTVHDSPVCKHCWAKYICGGICWFNEWQWSQEYREIRCNFMREIIKRVIRLQYAR